jgi:hypothetical protein
VTLRQTREDLRYTDAQIRRMEKEDEAEDRRKAELDPVSMITRNPVFQAAGQQPEPVGAGS